MKIPYKSADAFLNYGGIIRIEGDVLQFIHDRFDVPNLMINAKVCTNKTIEDLYQVAVKAIELGIVKYKDAGAKS